jgi:hypothetical protein
VHIGNNPKYPFTFRADVSLRESKERPGSKIFAALERNHRMGTNCNAPDEMREESSNPTIDFWSDEGARRYNKALDDGSAYVSAGARLTADFEVDFDDEPCAYVDPELHDPNEETLPPGEIELIFENSYVM